MSDKLLEAAQARAVQGELACDEAHLLAAELRVSPGELGRAISAGGAPRVNRCQLGLFGYGSKASGEHKIVLKAARVPAAIAAELDARVVNGRIPCSAVWEVAARFRYPRLGVANIVEAMGLKVAPCQLGCF